MLRGVTVEYNEGAPSPTAALDGIDLSVDEACCTAVVGPTGSGKTTLLEVLAGLTEPKSGTAALEGAPPGARLRDSVGLAYQFPESQFFEDTVFTDVAFGPERLGLEAGDVRARVEDALERAGLPAAEFAARSPLSLSAGEKRRAAIAGILALGRPFLLLDEPAAGLDPATAERIALLIGSEVEAGRGVVVVSHDLELVDRLASRTIVLGGGRVLDDGPTETVLSNGALFERLGVERPLRHELVDRLRGLGHPEADEIRRLLLRTRRPGAGGLGPLAGELHR